ncbi:MAG: response regulator [Chloroflexota bacterium]|jgi:DNA-binding NarL/FixJ family response regulator
MKPIRVMLIEEHAAVRLALETRLGSSPLIESIDAFADLSAALNALGSLRPDIILLGMDSGRAPRLRQKIETVVRLAVKDLPIMVLVPYVDDLEREFLLRVGASRYCLKNINTPQLLEEIEQTVQLPRSTTPLNVSPTRPVISGIT